VIDRVWAVVVARAGAGAKTRLSGVLGQPERTLLARAMLADVLDVCMHTPGLLDGTVLVADEAARDLGRHATRVVRDPGLGEMNAAVRSGLAAAREQGATTVVVLPGDLPSISSADLAHIVCAAGAAPRVVVVGASRDRQGTNALLLRPPGVIGPAFGPPSVDRHLEMALAAGALAYLVTDLGLSQDVDTPGDLASLSDARLGVNTAAALTRLQGRAVAAFI
jgi:2-phospho-L-lactate/phosphoenolpyruvate guanylyltransferase